MLARNLLSVSLAVSLAIFCLLVGVGSWLIGSPAPTWFPWRGPWIGGLLLVALALLLRTRLADLLRSALTARGDAARQPR